MSEIARSDRPGGVPEWLNGAVSKTVDGVSSSEGSNPSPSAFKLSQACSTSLLRALGALHAVWVRSGYRPLGTAQPARPCSDVQRTTSQGSEWDWLDGALPTVTQTVRVGSSRELTVRRCIRPELTLLLVAQAMPSLHDQSIGFEADHRDIPIPPVDVTDETRERLSEVLAAVVSGATPEEVTDYLEDGFPSEVSDMLARPGERQELSAHIDVLLTVLQSPPE